MKTLNPLKHIFGPAWFSIFFCRNWRNPTLVTTAAYIARLYGPFFWQLKWNDVSKIEGVQWDDWAYEEFFLLFWSAGGRRFVIGELNDGIKELESVLDLKCPGFPSDWKANVNASGLGKPIVLWKAD